MLGPSLTLIALSLSLAWAVFLDGGTPLVYWNFTLLAVGLLSGGYWVSTRRIDRATPLPRWHLWSMILLPLYLGFQALPIPLPLLHVLSPERWAMTRSLDPVFAGVRFAPIDANPPQALVGLFAILSYLATFLLVRELGWRFSERPWITATPLLVIGSLEAVIGVIQVVLNGPDAQATGTYANRNHFAGLLEMIAPFALLYGLVILRRGRVRHRSSLRIALAACFIWGAGALMLGAIAYSLSRMGFLVSLTSLFIVAGMLTLPRLASRWARILFLAFLPLAALFALLVFPPDQMIARFADLSAAHGVTSIDRLVFAKETLQLIRQFPLFGCGIGGFESTFLKHQEVANYYRVEFAHNDYLQFVVDLGFVGAVILAVTVFGVLRQVVNGIRRLQEEPRQFLVIACAGAFIAILLHSLVDFNMEIHANAMTLAWISGIGSINGLD